MAATINVGGGCTLVDAITAANSDAPGAGCTPGSGADTIFLPSLFSSQTLTTVNNDTYGPTGLPVITSNITIKGTPDEFYSCRGSRITRDSSAPEFRILAVDPTGNLTLECATVSGGAALSGAGIVNSGNLTLTDSTVSGNTAAYSGGRHLQQQHPHPDKKHRLGQYGGLRRSFCGLRRRHT